MKISIAVYSKSKDASATIKLTRADLKAITWAEDESLPVRPASERRVLAFVRYVIDAAIDKTR